MWTKVYLATVVVFAFLTGFVAYYAVTWLGSITAPADAYQGYMYYRGTAWWIIAITAGILLLLANIVLAKTGRGWAMWTTLVYFVVCVLVVGFVLPISEIGFLREKGIATEISNYLSPFIAIVVCVGFGALVYVNHLMAVRMRRNLVGSNIPETDSESEK